MADPSFVADTLKAVGRDMRGKEVHDEDVEEHVSEVARWLGDANDLDDASEREVRYSGLKTHS